MISLLEHALALDPQSVEAQSLLAIALRPACRWMTNSAAADIARAEGLVSKALAASPRIVLAHFAKGKVLRAQSRSEEAIAEYEMVLEINRNSKRRIARSRPMQVRHRVSRGSNPAQEQAIRLSPRDPGIANMYARIGFVHLLQSHIDEAIQWLEKARSANPEWYFVHASLASAYGLKGETERAAAELAEACRLTRRRLIFEHRSLARRIFRGAKDPRLVRSYLLGRPAQGRHAGAITADVSSVAA